MSDNCSHFGSWQGARQCWDQFKARDAQCALCFSRSFGDKLVEVPGCRVKPQYIAILDQGFVDGHIGAQEYTCLGHLIKELKEHQQEE